MLHSKCYYSTCTVLTCVVSLKEKQLLLKEMHKKVEEVKNERKKLDQLASKIKAMESKLLSGTGAIRIAKDQRDMRKKDIQQKRDEMIEMKVI